MTAPHAPKVAGIEPTFTGSAHTAAPAAPETSSATQPAAVHERLAAWLSDLTTLHDLTERLARTDTLDGALDELLRAGAFLVGARRGLVTLEPPDGLGPETTVGLGLGLADLGHLETVPRRATPVGRLLDGHEAWTPNAAVPNAALPNAAVPGDGVSSGGAGAAGASSGGAGASAASTVHVARPTGATAHGTGSAGPSDAPADSATGPPAPVQAPLGPPGSPGPSAAPTDPPSPPAAASFGLCELSQPDLAAEPGLDPRLREVAARLGYAASYAVPLVVEPLPEKDAADALSVKASEAAPHEGAHPAAPGQRRPSGADAAHVHPIGVAVWLYDRPAEPTERGRRLLALYRSYAAAHLSRLIELDRRRRSERALHAELLPARLPRVPGVRLAVRHATGPKGGGDWYDALPLPDGALSLSVGSVTGSGPSAVGAMGRLRAALRAYAVMEGEDPVAVLSDLELLLRLTEPARSATALFAFAEPPVTDPLGGPSARKIVLAGAGHCPPLIVGEHRTEFVETTLSAPLGMLSCWEAPSVELEPAPGETLLLYSDGLLHRSGDPVDRAFARLHAAAAGLPRSVREDPEALVDHLVRAMLPQGLTDETSSEDVVLLAARFEP
ncbi:PP2C family protein-serine/threonine phosphatase [Streptomyces sp. NPDC042319]|uniref:PP2C family protein-serine/threonine phosphatase n=1 Tax=Streptomyces sp. NPDC042319 TaxID=3154332 RepID=UPI0033C29B4D